MTRPLVRVFKQQGKKRLGKGYSTEELEKAGLSLRKAVKLGVPVDPRRKTGHEENVQNLKVFVEERKAAAKPKKKAKGKSKS